jgi:hypothetical protein
MVGFRRLLASLDLARGVCYRGWLGLFYWRHLASGSTKKNRDACSESENEGENGRWQLEGFGINKHQTCLSVVSSSQ